MRSPDESRPGATNTGAAATTKGAEVDAILPARRNWRTLIAPPTPVELLIVFGGAWIGAIVAVVR